MSEVNERAKRRRRLAITETESNQTPIPESVNTPLPVLDTDSSSQPQNREPIMQRPSKKAIPHHHVNSVNQKLKKHNQSLLALSIIEGIIISLLILGIAVYVMNGWTGGRASGLITGIMSTPTPIPTLTPSPTPSPTPTLTPAPSPTPTLTPTPSTTPTPPPTPIITPKPTPKVYGGVYDVNGYNDMRIAIYTDEDGIITSAYVVEHNESPQYGGKALDNKSLLNNWVGKHLDDVEVEAIAGCTKTTNALKQAILEARINDTTGLAKALKEYAAVKADSFEFRDGLRFGMTKQEVANIEGTPDIDEDIIWGYSVSVFGLDATLAIHFTSGITDSFTYFFTESHSSDNIYITDYNKVDEAFFYIEFDTASEDQMQYRC